MVTLSTRGVSKLFRLEIAVLSIQIHDLTDDVITYWHSDNKLIPRPAAHLGLKVIGAEILPFNLSLKILLVFIFLVSKE